jgi:alpha-beta hydrolase superfamily lysophospholipase
LHVLRFDYFGTGDSAGSSEEGSLAEWTADIASAATQLADLSGVRRVSLVGMRLGAVLAAAASARGLAVQDLVLWDPILSGRSYLSQLEAVERRARLELLAPQDQQPSAHTVLGFPLSESERSALFSLDLPTADLGRPQRLLVVTAGGRAGYDALRDHAKERAIATTLQVVNDPVVWGGEGRTGRHSAGARGARRDHGVPCASQHMREQAIVFGAHRHLVGVVTWPDAAAGRTARAAVMSNVGTHHRVGPFRLYVELARQLAAEGFVVIRFDLSGQGDSEIRPGALEGRASMSLDVGDAMQWLSEHAGADLFVLVGLCSGVDSTHAVSVADARVRGAVFIDGYTYPTAGFRLRHWTFRYLSVERWKRFLQRWWRHLRVPTAGGGVQPTTQFYSRSIPTRDEFRRDVAAMVARPVRMLFVYTGSVQFHYNARNQAVRAARRRGTPRRNRGRVFPQSGSPLLETGPPAAAARSDPRLGGGNHWLGNPREQVPVLHVSHTLAQVVGNPAHPLAAVRPPTRNSVLSPDGCDPRHAHMYAIKKNMLAAALGTPYGHIRRDQRSCGSVPS